VEFEWDDAKADPNLRKHGVSFTEAMSVFADPLSLTAPIQIIPRKKTDI